MKKLLLIIALSLPIAITPACTTPPAARVVQIQTLKIVGASAKATVDASAQLLKQGRLTVPQWQKIAEFYDTKFQPSFRLAVAAAGSDLSSIASPDLVELASDLSALVAQFTSQNTP